MNEETARIIWETMTQEQREALVTYTQEAERAFRELAENISASITDMLDAVVQAFANGLQPIIDEFIDELDSLDVTTERHKKWKPVKNTVPRYNCVQRKITPHARSCC